MASQWFYKHNGEKFGPVTTEQLKTLAGSQQLLAADLIWKVGMAEWANARRMMGLFDEFGIEDALAPTIPECAAPEPFPSHSLPPIGTALGVEGSGRPRSRALFGKLAQLGSGLKAAAQLTVKQAICAKLNLRTMPRAYRKLGQHIEAADFFNDEFPSLFQEHQKLKLGLAELARKTASRPMEEPFGPKIKSSLIEIKEDVQAWWLQHRVKKLLATIGEAAFKKSGEQSGPADVVDPIVQATARLSDLNADMATLSNSNRIQLSILRRTAFVVLTALLLAGILLHMIWPHRVLHEVSGSRTREAVSKLSMTSVPKSFGSSVVLAQDWAKFETAMSSNDTQAELSSLAQIVADADKDPDQHAGRENAAIAYSLRSSLLFGLDANEALVDARQAIALAPENSNICLAYIIRGASAFLSDKPNVSLLCYQPSQSTRDAISDFRRAIALHPPNQSWAAMAHWFLAEEEFMASNDTSAADDLSQAVFLDPHNESIVSFQRAMPTLTFWRNTWRSVATADAIVKSANFQQSLQIIRLEADHIASLNTVGVDQDAVQCALLYKDWLREMAEVSESSASGEKMVEAFMRGAAGDPFGTAVEEIKSADELNNKLKEVQRQYEDTTSILSARYNVEF